MGLVSFFDVWQRSHSIRLQSYSQPKNTRIFGLKIKINFDWEKSMFWPVYGTFCSLISSLQRCKNSNYSKLKNITASLPAQNQDFWTKNKNICRLEKKYFWAVPVYYNLVASFLACSAAVKAIIVNVFFF